MEVILNVNSRFLLFWMVQCDNDKTDITAKLTSEYDLSIAQRDNLYTIAFSWSKHKQITVNF